MKRATDALILFLTGPLWIPLLLIIACAVRLKLGRPIFFKQPRPGLNGRVFTLWKFRTLSANGVIPPFGRWLRSTSLDELPQILNVFGGEMSLVGPRPLLVEYLDRYNPEQKRRHDVKPGLTGWAQINGRNAISWKEKFQLDLWYVDHQSFWLDLKILAKTFARLLHMHGVNHSDNISMPEFTGEND